MNKWNGFERGVNLGGWLSQCDYSDDRLDNFIKSEDFDRIASWGLDHVRLPIDFNIFELVGGEERGFGYIDFALGNCRRCGLNIIIDLHKTKGFSFDDGEREEGFFESEELQENFYRLWESIAKRYGGDPEHIAFELLNEVTDKAYCERWNAIANKCIERIRAFAPQTVILVGSYWNNSVEAVPDLEAPHDDRIVYNFHCYVPIKFTHQGATWTELVDPRERQAFEQSGTSAEMFDRLFAPAIAAAEKNGTLLYCGEYGVIDRATPEDTVKWYTEINKVFKAHGIGRAAWTYRQMDFGLSDERLAGVIGELTKLL